VQMTPIGNGLSGVEQELSPSHRTLGHREERSAHTPE
jgi:hypothetical protein